MWKEMDATIAAFEERAAQFTNPENKRKWGEANELLTEFRAAQDKAEAIAFTPDAFPATKLLVTEAGPRAETIFSEITRMINEEEGLEATAERKRLLKAMADLRGNFAAATAQLRMHLLSGEKNDKERFFKPWALFEKGYAAVARRRTCSRRPSWPLSRGSRRREVNLYRCTKRSSACGSCRTGMRPSTYS